MTVPQKRIASAFAVGLVLVTGAFLLSRYTHNQNREAASVTDAMEREHVTVTDSDKDGIPDWQDALLSDEPIILDSGTTTKYTPPTTVTGKVAIDFFKKILSAKKYGPFGSSNEKIVQDTTAQLQETVKDPFFVATDLQITEATDTATLRMYSNNVASILLSANTGDKNELLILQDSLQYSDDKKLEELDPIITAYGNMIVSMTQVTVPASYIDEHLNLLNALSAIREDIVGMRNINEDALYGFARVKRYKDDVLGLSKTITTLFDTLYTKDGVRFTQADQTLKLITFAQ